MISEWAFEKTTGKRVKRLAEKNGYDRAKIAAALGGYADNSITRFYSGKQHFSDDQLEKLAELFGVQVGFLKCETDYETEDAMYEDIARQYMSDHKTAMAYLKNLGLNITAKLYYVCTGGDLYRTYFFIEDYMSEETKDKLSSFPAIKLPSHDKYDHLSHEERYNKLCEESDRYFGDETEYYSANETHRVRHYYIELLANPHSGYLGELNLTNNTPDIKKYATENTVECDEDGYLHINCASSPEDEFCSDRLQILYSVKLNDKFLGLYELDNLDRLFDVLDSVCTATIKSILDSEYPTIVKDNSYFSSVI